MPPKRRSRRDGSSSQSSMAGESGSDAPRVVTSSRSSRFNKRSKRHSRDTKREKQRRNRSIDRSTDCVGASPRRNRTRDGKELRRSDNVRSKRQKRSKSKSESPEIVKHGEYSLSIEETNKLRVKLGLKPLDISDKQARERGVSSRDPTEKSSADYESVPDPDIHAPAPNIGETKKTELLREKLSVVKEKRELEAKIYKFKEQLPDDKEVSTEEWLKQLDNKLCQKVIKQDELNDVEREHDCIAIAGYDSKDLGGIKVEHGEEDIKEGTTTILTLKDADVLADSEDVLVNVNIVDDKRAKRNALLRSKKFAYTPYEETDQLEKHVLSKYDEEIFGKQASTFVLNESGTYDVEEERCKQRAREQLASASVDLSTVLKPLSDYMDPSEIKAIKFRASRRDEEGKGRKRTVRRKMLKADDLLEALPKEDLNLQNSDLACRDADNKDSDEDKKKSERPLKKEESDEFPSLLDDQLLGEIDDPDDVVLKNERPSQPSSSFTAHMVADKLRKRHRHESPHSEECHYFDGLPSADAMMVLDSMSEFCRTLGEVPLVHQDEPTTPASETPSTVKDVARLSESVEQNEQINQNVKQTEEQNVTEAFILDEEPMIDRGLAEALKLAKTKGYLESSKARRDARVKASNISAVHYTIEERTHYDIDDKFARKDRYAGPLSDFREKAKYRPAVSLEYLGEDGRKMSMKEAFRYLSHRFHGKGSGKRKTEKRMLKIREEEAMKHMSSVDTPLQTVTMMQQKQKELQQPFISLSTSKSDPTMMLKKM